MGNPLQGAHGLFPKTQTVLSEAHGVDFKSTWVNRERYFRCGKFHSSVSTREQRDPPMSVPSSS